MSATNSQPIQQHDLEGFDCKHPDCEREEPIASEPVGAYCSPACQQRDHGRRLLNVLREDHRYCFTCFRQLKAVTDVPEWRTRTLGPATEAAVTGLQTRTRDGVLGQRSRPRDDHGRETYVGTICRCGNATPGGRWDVIRAGDLPGVVVRLQAAVERTRREGQHDYHLDPGVLAWVLRLQARYGRDWCFERAVGAAMEAQ